VSDELPFDELFDKVPPFDMGYYILERHEVVHVERTLPWAMWFETHQAECRVGHDQVGDYEISTMFMGLDMGLARLFPGNGNHRPLLFETAVFSGFHREGRMPVMERCSTWEEAEAQHARIVADFRKAVAG
jgi:hypothetical protein